MATDVALYKGASLDIGGHLARLKMGLDARKPQIRS